jgi:hypothetical protein
VFAVVGAGVVEVTAAPEVDAGAAAVAFSSSAAGRTAAPTVGPDADSPLAFSFALAAASKQRKIMHVGWITAYVSI